MDGRYQRFIAFNSRSHARGILRSLAARLRLRRRPYLMRRRWVPGESKRKRPPTNGATWGQQPMVRCSGVSDPGRHGSWKVEAAKTFGSALRDSLRD
jgi:hypothetical protein